MKKVVVNTSENYRYDRVDKCLDQIIDQMGGIERFIKPGMRVAVKPNLLMAKKPEDAATTHPAVVKGIITRIQKAGGIVTIVESPGGPYNGALLKRVYSVTGMEKIASETGAELNYDLRVEKIDNPGAKVVKTLKILKPLFDADLIVNIAKLKTHGMMVYTGAVKNMFGSIAGMEKADYHLRLDDYDRFADSLIDIFLATKPQINIIDGIIAMEGDGPSAGVPKYLGVLLASEDAFACDYAALQVIGLDYRAVPVLKMAEERDLFSPDQIEFEGVDIKSVKADSFEVPALQRMRPLERLKFLGFLKKMFRPKPEIIHDKCILCKKCMEVCPPQAISKSQDSNMEIDYSKCISCFCCHEFCPQKAVRIRKNTIRKVLQYKRFAK